ncbi:3-hydroxyacyl-CoA dehydrogenase family protein [Mycobacteroides salmoniphilum]|uniref:3-hydroxyacyl-CoA dehydrogenase family protein n=1 Tax=Mycobacteroides salmoniphilum TaxID=404941 RepID=UPI001F20B926|nr:3-hydroxyacyl-CoA dehydrogenase NAD-binding domain-containing protein [Mycobacteroides salmoniphilum]
MAVIGAGTLGRRIALMFATRGGLVRISDPVAEQGSAAVEFVSRQIGALAGSRSDFTPGRAEYARNLTEAVRDAWLVIEAVPEHLELKKQIFRELVTVAPTDTILASNTSSYATRLIAEGLPNTDRILNTHFYMPPDQIAVDVMSCGTTSQEVIAFVLAAYPQYGLRPFLVRQESTGFIFNRIWAAIKRESLAVVAEGVSVPEDIDEMFMLTVGTRSGPFRAMDHVGLDVVLDIEEHYAAENPELPAGPRRLLRKYIAAGKLGAKTGEGFYADYLRPGGSS